MVFKIEMTMLARYLAAIPKVFDYQPSGQGFSEASKVTEILLGILRIFTPLFQAFTSLYRIPVTVLEIQVLSNLGSILNNSDKSEIYSGCTLNTRTLNPSSHPKTHSA